MLKAIHASLLVLWLAAGCNKPQDAWHCHDFIADGVTTQRAMCHRTAALCRVSVSVAIDGANKYFKRAGSDIRATTTGCKVSKDPVYCGEVGGSENCSAVKKRCQEFVDEVPGKNKKSCVLTKVGQSL